MKHILRLIVLIWFFLAIPSAAEDGLKDHVGRPIVVTKPFKRIISLYGAHSENLFYLGLDEAVIGVRPSDKSLWNNQDKPVFSYHDGPEKFLAAAPDLVLIRPMIDRAYPRLVSRLEKHGITVLSFQPASIDQMYEYWLMLGLLTGKTREAMGMAMDFKRAVRQIKAKTSAIQTPKRVYFEAMHQQMRTFTKDSMAMFCLDIAGGINVARDAEASHGSNIGIYGKERILSHAHDIDVFLVQRGRMNPVDLATIKTEPGFGIIKAVKNNQIYLIDETLVSRPTPRLLEGIKTIARALYPNLGLELTEVPGA